MKASIIYELGKPNGWADKKLSPLILNPSKCWQPSDFIPNTNHDQLMLIKNEAKELPKEVVAVIVGDMITEEALPAYMSMLNRSEFITDKTGDESHVWANWTRSWTAEENRHGDLLNRWLFISDTVDMRKVEMNTHKLISNGFNANLKNDPYKCFVYTSFQERATKISHRRTANLANKYGAVSLAKICGIISADEARHEEAYQLIIEELLRIDTDSTLVSIASVFRDGIQMPAKLMPGFDSFADVATKIGVYTPQDYVSIMEYLIIRWNILEIVPTSSIGREAQDKILKSYNVSRKLAERYSRRNNSETIDESLAILTKTLF